MKGKKKENDGRRLYSLEQLLRVQNRSMKKHTAFTILVEMLTASPALERVRLSRRAYRLLNEARLEERYLPNFYATYRIRADPFFSLFLKAARECAETREEARAARGRRILAIVETYPPEVLSLIKYLAKAERERNADFPVWKEELFPHTLKKAREMAAFGLTDWLPLFDEYIASLRTRYRRLELPPTEALFSRLLARRRKSDGPKAG